MLILLMVFNFLVFIIICIFGIWFSDGVGEFVVFEKVVDFGYV